MEPNRILITGQFWDREFADLINGMECPATLLTCESIERAKSLPGKVDLVLVAQSGRETISQGLIDHLHAMLGRETPIINLLGSWCEGQERSGKPLQNVLPIYWHQWAGGIKQLMSMANAGQACPQEELIPAANLCVGVSALSYPQASYLEDALEFLGAETVWLEHQEWQAERPTQNLQAICVDGDSLTAKLAQRLAAIRGDHPSTPLIVILNFPRKEEVQELSAEHNVVAVVSKPFDLTRLARAVGQATGTRLIAAEPLIAKNKTAGLQPVEIESDDFDSDSEEFNP
jgi:CheY-like chemotaxis protein